MENGFVKNDLKNRVPALVQKVLVLGNFRQPKPMTADKKKYNPIFRENLIVNLTFQFSLDLLDFVALLEVHRKFTIANQLVRSGTSIGANVREAQNAESRADFIHKMKIAAKEADETEYWIELCQYSKGYPDATELLSKILSIKKALAKIIGTSKTKTNQVANSTNESSN